MRHSQQVLTRHSFSARSMQMFHNQTDSWNIFHVSACLYSGVRERRAVVTTWPRERDGAPVGH